MPVLGFGMLKRFIRNVLVRCKVEIITTLVETKFRVFIVVVSRIESPFLSVPFFAWPRNRLHLDLLAL